MWILKSESDFQTKMLEHIKSKGGIGFKISDSDCRLKMADCVVTYNAWTYWIELKYRGLHSHPSVLQHQENSCRRVWDAGWKYYFVEYDARTHSLKVLTGYIPPKITNLTEAMILEEIGLEDFIK